MSTGAIGTALAAQASFGFGPSEWITVGLVIAFLVVAVVIPTVVANRASWRRAPRAEGALRERPARMAATRTSEGP